MTKQWHIARHIDEAASQEALSDAAELLRQGQTVAFPTETVYGLGADATNTDAVKQIFMAKGRPSDNPLIVHIADRQDLPKWTKPVEGPVEQLMEAFWPGPLTIIFPVRQGTISPLVTAGLSTVGIRIPDNTVARELIRLSGRPIAAPSANSSGKPSPTRAEHVLADLDGRIGGIVEAGSATVGLESTVVEWAQDALHILRPGGVTAEQLREALPGVTVIAPAGGEPSGDAAESIDMSPGIAADTSSSAAIAGEAPRAPGMKYAHYAPRGRMILVDGADPDAVASTIRRELRAAKSRGERTGVLTRTERSALYEEADVVVACGTLAAPHTIAQGLFAALRQFDQDEATFILAESCPEHGIGAAIMNRLRKAAGGNIIHSDEGH
ncbi:L-threonylcarbamoyladenylate synthase [Paenibacillus sp. N1-5-1-14]|uniref:L-threonylcarbamoyladenylate synthase n=1 Tax=Paenibacillus radicibacter TaxID=2972488 RepID=UPI002159848F|nr:L-threonylcarbamoyladenylate synthase [Paenibacillus radicibacter]MCR8645105.1 L-threonylcarbamoyladenylate synthase [Paenibacillus radicibacter]